MRKGLPDIPPERRKGVFTARYPGRCGVCDEDIELGDDCHYVNDEVSHEDCE